MKSRSFARCYSSVSRYRVRIGAGSAISFAGGGGGPSTQPEGMVLQQLAKRIPCKDRSEGAHLAHGHEVLRLTRSKER